MTYGDCSLCGGACKNGSLEPLTAPDLSWLWEAVAEAADRRGDPDMVEGAAITVRLPEGSAQRSAAAGIVGGTRPGQRVRVALHTLADLARSRGAELTPGAVAAHVVKRPLAVRAAQTRARGVRFDATRKAMTTACDDRPGLAGRGEDLYEHLRRSGWVARLDASDVDAAATVTAALEVVATVLSLQDGERIDRRLLVPGAPHALDDGTPLAGTSLALLVGLGHISSRTEGTSRTLWAQASVDCDDLMGGLAVLGIAPDGWHLPTTATCTIPPRELLRATWPAPTAPDSWVFVTENPSVLAAAADLAGTDPEAGPVRLICTMGTPSATEVVAIANLATAGWKVAVRADFDAAGIRHVTALLEGVPDAVPWRMDVYHYNKAKPATPANARCPATPWDLELSGRMNENSLAAYEEGLVTELLSDLRSGQPTTADGLIRQNQGQDSMLSR